MSKLKNKTLFVSGASRGIGLAIAKKAAEEIEEAGGKAFPVM